jgi:hypothetical protein
MDLSGYIYDYRLGYVREGTLGGFDVLGEDSAPDGRIITLGGYTTPDLAAACASWSNFLYEALDGTAHIYNGCTDGYTSAQELMMFIRDGILLKPTLVVQLSGFHDIAYKLGLVREKHYAPILKKHPFATPRQIAFYEKITARFGLGNDKVFYGEEDNTPAWESWLSRVESLHTLCIEFGLRHLAFLQPCAFSAGYSRRPEEDAAILADYDITFNELTGIATSFQEQYAKVKEVAMEKDYIIDLSDLFDGESGIYTDACRLRREYTDKLAQAIRQKIMVEETVT